MSFVEAGAPKIIMDITNLADGFTLTNTDAGKAFNLENPGQKTDKVLVKVVPFDLKLLDLNWTGCPELKTLLSWRASGRMTVTVNTQLRLQVEVLGVLNVSADIVPHRKRSETNEFTVTGGTWVATADPFGVGSGLQALGTRGRHRRHPDRAVPQPLRTRVAVPQGRLQVGAAVGARSSARSRPSTSEK